MSERIIHISSGSVTVTAQLADTPTGNAIWNALPITSEVNTWGDEIYFSIPVTIALEPDAAEVVACGDLGYWPNGSAFCIFFGPTPVSRPGEIRPASAVNVFGKVRGDTSVLKQVRPGSRIVVARADT
ncbi:MAG: cyclophilin-like fold protein [Desulfobacterota bacterium]|nr:cyclophilin-like fold protein [Thermodesulfobacteriota bacterium]